MRHYHPGIAPYIQDTNSFQRSRNYGLQLDPRRRLPRVKTLEDVQRLLAKVHTWNNNRRNRLNAVVAAIWEEGVKPDTSTGTRLAHAFPYNSQEQFKDDRTGSKCWWVYCVSPSEYEGAGLSYSFKWVVEPVQAYRPLLGKQLYDLEQQASTRVHIVKERFKELLESWVEHHFPHDKAYSEPSLSVRVNETVYFLKLDKDLYTGRLVKVEWLPYAVHHTLDYTGG